jgi:hypothetical protein
VTAHTYLRQTPTFRSLHSQAEYHAALRAFGAGPITLTDVPGKTDPIVLRKLVGNDLKRASGRSIALHASRSPFVSNDVFEEGLMRGGSGKALRVFSRREEDGKQGGLIGYWNVRSSDGKVRAVPEPCATNLTPLLSF